MGKITLQMETSVRNFRFKWHTWETSKLGNLLGDLFSQTKLRTCLEVRKNIKMVEGKILHMGFQHSFESQ